MQQRVTLVASSPTNLHVENIARLRLGDVVVASYPGSGSTWLANVLEELSLDYVDGYTERLVNTCRGREATPVNTTYRSRIAALRTRDQMGTRQLPGSILLKTHFYPEAFEPSSLTKVILLVRDARDATISYYHWRLGFSEEGEHGSLSEFLARPGFNGTCPAQDWCAFNTAWLTNDSDVLTMRFEDTKSCPEAEVRRLTTFLGIQRSCEEIELAVSRSTFHVMRRHEQEATTASTGNMIMRAGKIGSWRDELSTNDRRHFSATSVRRCLERFGYDPAPT